MRGLKAIGNFEVDLSWSAGRLHTLRVRSLSGRPLTLALPGIERATIRAKRGKRPRPDRTTPGRLSFPTHPGAVYTITLPGGIPSGSALNFRLTTPGDLKMPEQLP